MITMLENFYTSAKDWMKRGCSNIEAAWSSEVMGILLINFVKSVSVSGFVIGLEFFAHVEVGAPAVAFAAAPFGFLLLATVNLIKVKHFEHKKKQFKDDVWDIRNICTLMDNQPLNRAMRRVYLTTNNQNNQQNNQNNQAVATSWRTLVEHPKIRSCIHESESGVGKVETTLLIAHAILETAYSTLGLAGATFAYFTFYHNLFKNEITSDVAKSALSVASITGFAAGGFSLLSEKKEWQKLKEYRKNRDDEVSALRQRLDQRHYQFSA